VPDDLRIDDRLAIEALVATQLVDIWAPALHACILASRQAAALGYERQRFALAVIVLRAVALETAGNRTDTHAEYARPRGRRMCRLGCFGRDSVVLADVGL